MKENSSASFAKRHRWLLLTIVLLCVAFFFYITGGENKVEEKAAPPCYHLCHKTEVLPCATPCPQQALRFLGNDVPLA